MVDLSVNLKEIKNQIPSFLSGIWLQVTLFFTVSLLECTIVFNN